MTKQIIVAPAIAATPSTSEISADAKALKTTLLGNASGILITKDSDALVRDRAIDVAGQIAGHLKKVESDREAIKAPFLEMGRAIDAIAKAHRIELEAELNRLNRGIGAVNQRLTEEHIAEQKRLADEAAKAEQDRLDALKKQEELALAAQPKTKKAQAAQLAKELDLQEAAETAATAISDVDQKRIELAEQRRQVAHTGGAQRTEIEVEITDIKALYAAQPTCVKLTADIVQIKWIENNRPELLPLPGVTITKRPVFSARAR